jgi:hypothetical protein
MRRLLSLLALTAIVACQDQGPVDLTPPSDGSPAFSDAVHNNGNQAFYLLPPMVPDPPHTGVFNARLRPSIRICALPLNAPTGCVTPLAEYTMSGGTDGTAITVSTSDQHYRVNWHTDNYAVDHEKTYRILFYLSEADDALLLGYADVQFGSNMREVKNIQTEETIGLVDGRTLPVKFRIEEGASCGGEGDCGEAVVGPDGGVVTTVDGRAGVSIPADALDGDLLITVGQIDPASQPWGRCLPTGLRQEEGCYEFDTEPAISEVNELDAFNVPVTVAVCLDPGAIRPDNLTLHKYDAERPTQGVIELENAAETFLNCEGFMVASAPGGEGVFGWLASAANRALSPVRSLVFPRLAFATDLGRGGLTDSFSFIGWAEPVFLEEVIGVPTEVAPGAVLYPEVRAMTAHNHHEDPAVPASGAELRFQYTDPTGAVSILGTAVTLGNGTVAFDWPLTPALGTHTLEVSTRSDLNGEPVLDETEVLQIITTATVAGAFCDGDPECGAAVVGPGGGIVTTQTGHAGVSIPVGALGGDLLVTVRRVHPDLQPWANCLPTGLRQEEGCYEFDTDPAIIEVNDQSTFFEDVTVAVCLDPAADRPDNLTLHKYDPDQPQAGVVELTGTTESFLDCDNFTGSGPIIGVSGGPLRWLAAAADRALGPVRSWLLPQLAFATDLGRGGLTDSFSFIGWAEPVTLTVVSGAPSTADPGEILTPVIQAMTAHNHQGEPAVPASGARLRFDYTDPTEVGTQLPYAFTDANGQASVDWPLTQADGIHSLVVSTRGMDGNTVVGDPTLELELTTEVSTTEVQVLIDFEQLPDGTLMTGLVPLHVTDEYAALGVTFSFVRSDETPTAPTICESSFFDPEAGNHSLGFESSSCGSGGFTGTLTMAFPAGADTVTMQLRGNNDLQNFGVSAFDVSGAPLVVSIPSSTTFVSAGGITVREEHYLVAAPGGNIASVVIHQGPGGGMIKVDDLYIRKLAQD